MSQKEEFFWYLEGYIAENRTWRTVLRSFPVVVGRSSSTELRLDSEKVSQRHAEVVLRDGELWLRDLESTNGTLLNYKPVTKPTKLVEGDVVLFADREFRVARFRPSDDTATMDMSTAELQAYLAGRARNFHHLLEQELIVPHLQPVVNALTGMTMGYEVLSRGNVDGSIIPAAELFSVAEELGLEEQLSRLCRQHGMQVAERLEGSPVMFLNTHPSELEDLPSLVGSLTELRSQSPDIPVVLEMHEAAATEAKTVRSLTRSLDQLGYKLAFDDFGAGQSRLKEIADAPPHFLKFDKGLVRKVDQSFQRFELISSLVPMVQSLGIQPIAEGVETEAEAAACRKMGFELAQGYHFGYPEPHEPDNSAGV